MNLRMYRRHPTITTIKMISGEEIVAIVVCRGRRFWTIAVPMKIAYDDRGAVHLVPWITAAVELDGAGGFKWSDQAFDVAADHITIACYPMPVVKQEYLKRLKDPNTWLNGSGTDIDSFSVPEGIKIQ